jgi:hypothetical protein
MAEGRLRERRQRAQGIAVLPSMPVRRRGRTQLDVTPTTVDVTHGFVVFWDGAQRSGRLHDVPAYLAMFWRKHGWASIVSEPAGAGVASRSRDDMARVQRRGHDRTPCESDDLRDASTDLTDDEPPRPAPTPGMPSGTPCASDKNGLYGSPQIPYTNAVVAQQDPYQAPVPNRTPADGDRTGCVRVRQCPKCSAPVAGRRKWCSEACRLQAYRERHAAQ